MKYHWPDGSEFRMSKFLQITLHCIRVGNAIYAGGGWIWQVLSDGKSNWRTQKVSSALQR